MKEKETVDTRFPVRRSGGSSHLAVCVICILFSMGFSRRAVVISSSVRSLSWSFLVGIWCTSTRVHGTSRETIAFG